MHSDPRATLAVHHDNIMEAGAVDEEYFACVHTPVDNWRKIPEAKKAVDKERFKLENDRQAWDMSTARPKDEVIA